MKRPASRSSRGFTLLEILVAMFLFAMVLAAVYSSWLAIMRGAATGRKAAADVQRARIAMATLEQALSAARSFAADLENYSFEAQNGSDAYLSFVAKLPASFPRSGRFEPFDVRRLTFAIEPAGHANNLVLRQTPLLMEMDIDEEEHPIVLARNVRAFEMEFWDRRENDWIDEWTETNALPPMVKITLQFNHDASSRMRDEISAVVALPSITVPPVWQNAGRGPGAVPRQGTRR